MLRRGGRWSDEARAKLEGPAPPDELDYLHGWLLELQWGRQLGPHGLQPFSWTDVWAWARLMGRAPRPYEVRALMLLDSVARSPDKRKGE